MKQSLLTLIIFCVFITPSSFTQTETADYSLTFEAAWSAGTHPDSFPPGPHFSGLIGAVHNGQVKLWEKGELASDGIEQMAETGGKTNLRAEINSAINDGTALSLIDGGGIGRSPGETSISSIQVSLDYPLITVVSMIAPSPDWFVGTESLNMLQDGDWIREIEIELFPYDSGTDSGANFTLPNADTHPPEPVFAIEGAPFLNNGELEPLGVFRFVRTDAPSNVSKWELYD